jgi:heparan-alpha-glucosaminide N-acetyltransferase
MTAAPSPRLASIDAYRGMVMFLMMAEVLHLGRMAKAFPDSPFWQFLGLHQSHVEWRGCTLHDLIQPSFSFLVGVALPFSIAARVARGQSMRAMFGHAFVRALILVLLGVFLRSVGKKATNWTFEDTLSQIGLGYVFLFALGFARARLQWIVTSAILVGYWALFAVWPAPGPDFDWKAVGVSANWEHHPTGFEAHWDKNSNPAYAFEQWLYQYLPRANQHNGGGYATLSFVPTLATMILGLIAGTWLKQSHGWPVVGRFLAVGFVLLGVGYGLDHSGFAPSVKRIWTPTWTIFSGGWCFVFLGLFTAFTDTIGRSGWSYPLRVIGANSIVAYVGSHLIEEFVLSAFKTHLGADVFRYFGKEYEPFVAGIVVLAVYWLILWWMYRNRIFVRI